METLTNLPAQGQFVSAVQFADGVLTLRLRPESVMEPDAAAYVLRAHGLVGVESVLRAVEALHEAGEYVYVYAKDGAVVLSGESGEEVLVRASRFMGERCELNATEFREALAFALRLYENAHQAERKAEVKLQRVRELLHEQWRRIAAKAEGHEPASSTGVLYAQHAHFIERVLREYEA